VNRLRKQTGDQTTFGLHRSLSIFVDNRIQSENDKVSKEVVGLNDSFEFRQVSGQSDTSPTHRIPKVTSADVENFDRALDR
jgi:hypothetical protein